VLVAVDEMIPDTFSASVMATHVKDLNLGNASIEGSVSDVLETIAGKIGLQSADE
jgi:hypothetical protein